MNYSYKTAANFIVREDFVSPLLGVFFLVIFLVLVFITYNFRTYIKTILFSNLSSRSLNENEISESNKNRKAGLWLTAFFLFIVSLLLYNLILVIPSFRFLTNSVTLFSCIGVVFICYAFKYLIKKTIGKVFHKERLTMLLFNHSSSKDKVLGILLFPFLLLHNFNLVLQEISLILILSISFIYFIIRCINGFLIGIKHGNIPYFYSFLYICTLEIIPLVLLVKVFSKPILSFLAY